MKRGPSYCINVLKESLDLIDYLIPPPQKWGPQILAGSISMDYFQAYIYSSAIDNLSLLHCA